MNKFSIENEENQYAYTSVLPLTAIGVKVRKMKLFEPIEREVKIAQKIVKHRPVDKLKDGYIAILAGAQGMVEVNKRVRAERAVQAAFGRTSCAEQSVVQETLDACTEQNVTEMHRAMEHIFRRQSQSYRHDYQREWQLLEVDMSGRPCGRKAALATKGYFAKQRNRRGRQEGYLIATWYEEIVVERIYEGTTQLNRALRPLVEAAESCLELDEAKRNRTILRVDSGGGSVEDINWALERGYRVHIKDYSGSRAAQLAKSVSDWFSDPADPARQFGWVTDEASAYVRPVRRIAVRCRKENGQWGIGVIVSNLEPKDVLWLSGGYRQEQENDAQVLLAYVHFYDQRGGAIEIEIKEDKQGLSTTKRNKKRFAAQQILTQLEVLAHNTLIWARRWLANHCPRLARFGLKRWVRDILHLNGVVVFDQHLHLIQLILNPADPLAKELSRGLAALLAAEHVAVYLGET
ncbi:MAG TPA: transposase [Levilinea sp.]|nr:transposase [Levilinea sp.]